MSLIENNKIFRCNFYYLRNMTTLYSFYFKIIDFIRDVHKEKETCAENEKNNKNILEKY